jgi:hypothetical protein
MPTQSLDRNVSRGARCTHPELPSVPDVQRHSERTVLAGVGEARTEAVVVSGEMLKDHGRKFWNNGEWRLHVTNEAGETVCIRFAAEHPFGGFARVAAKIAEQDDLPQELKRQLVIGLMPNSASD